MHRYKLLGLVQSCTKDEIKKAFHKMAMIHHPDKGGDVKKFIEVKEAYEWLMKYHDESTPIRKEYTQEPVRGYKKTVTTDQHGNTTTVIYYNVS